MKFINELEGLFLARLSVIKNTYKLARLEASLAKENLSSLLFYFFLLIPLLVVLWLTLIIGAGVLAFILIHNLTIVTVGLLIIQCALIVIIKRKISAYLREISFPRTRSCLTSELPVDANE